MKKNAISADESTMAQAPAINPPNHALAITAPKNKKTKGKAMTCCNGKVHSSATRTKQIAMANGFMPCSIVNRESRLNTPFVMLA